MSEKDWSKAIREPLSFAELLSRYAKGDRKFVSFDLCADGTGDLSGVCLDDIDLSWGMMEASFKGASLRRAIFHGANVKCCDFTNADLTDADFTESAIDGAAFLGARLDGAKFDGAGAYGHTLSKGQLP